MYRTLLNLPYFVLFAVLLLCSRVAAAQIADLEDLTPSVPYAGPGGGAYWNGSDKTVSGEYVNDWKGERTVYRANFTSSGIAFVNEFADWAPNAYFPQGTTSWTGWAYSNTTDTATADFENQYSAYAGGGYGSSAIYAVYGDGFGDDFAGATVTGIPAGALQGAYFTNTTYAALSMLNGDSFAKKFGGASGDDEDWFLLTVMGLDASDQTTGEVDFYLADYRFADNAEDYVVSDWTWVDLSSLGDATQLQFALSSSDSGLYGMNTPAYFAMDSLTLGVIPEPSGLLLALCGGLVGLASFRRRRAPRGR